MQRVRKRVLITVKAYPLPSRGYGELVCTAGFDEQGNWTRVYPVPLAFLNSREFRKYKWVELDLVKKDRDFRPESYSPANLDLRDIVIVGELGTQNNWVERKKICLARVYGSLRQLWDDSKDPRNTSLATFRPTEILKFIFEEEDREWKQQWQDQWRQINLFSFKNDDGSRVSEMIRKLPYKFSYTVRDDEGTISTMMIEDWEIGALYWNCLARAEGDEATALEKVRMKYEDEFKTKRDLYLFLGTTIWGHGIRAKNPFVIVGVFYPPRETGQLGLGL